MALRASKVTRKGQVTIPVEFRKKFHIEEGDTVFFEERGDHVLIVRPEDTVDWTSGALRQYAKGRPLTPEEMREIAAQAIAEQVLSEIE